MPDDFLPSHWLEQLNLYARDFQQREPDAYSFKREQSEPKFYGYETPVPDDDATLYERLRRQHREMVEQTIRLQKLQFATPVEAHVEDGVEVYTITSLEERS